jgi:hypothetical protein
MKESKMALTDRLRKEGRWEEASLFKDEVIKKLRLEKTYKTKFEAAEDAWEQMEAKYPPLPETEIAKEEKATVSISPIPWQDLPTKAEFSKEVEWVHQQFVLIVEETPRGRKILWDNASEPPPSTGACSMALWAADNRTAFYKDILPKAMTSATPGGDEDGLVREEKKSIAEVQRIIEKMSA